MMHKALIVLLGFALVPFVAARSCTARSGYTIHGANLGGPQLVPSAELCCSLCASMVTCRAAIYVPSNQSCQRKTSAAHQVVSAGSTVLVPGATTLPPPTTTVPPEYPPLQQSWVSSVTPQDSSNIMSVMRGNRIAALVQGKFNGEIVTINGTTGDIINSNILGGLSLTMGSSAYDSYLRVVGGLQFFLLDSELNQVCLIQLPSLQSLAPVYDPSSHAVVTFDPTSGQGIVAYNASNTSQVLWTYAAYLQGLEALGGGTGRIMAITTENVVLVLDALSGRLLLPTFVVLDPPVSSAYQQISFVADGLEYFFTASGGNLTKYFSINGSVAGTYAPPPGSEYIGIQTGMWPDALGFYVTVLNTTNATNPTTTAAVSWSGVLQWIGDWACPYCNAATADAHGRYVYSTISAGSTSVATLTARNRRTGKVVAQLNGPFVMWPGTIAAFDHGVAACNYTNPQSTVQSIMGYTLPTNVDRGRAHP